MSYFDRLDHYELLKLDTEGFPAPRELPAGYEWAEDIGVEAERALLDPVFPGSHNATERRLAGWRDDTVVAITHDGQPVGVCYVCGDNQLGLPGYGELHYAAVLDEHKGKGLWGAMIREMLRRAQAWGDVSGVIFVTDRKGPIEMYLRMGAQRIGTRPKGDGRPLWRRAASRARRIAGGR